MGNSCGKSKQPNTNKNNSQQPNKGNQSGKNEQITEDTTNNMQQQQYYQPKEGTITSYEDIRQIYDFEENVIGCGQFGAVRVASLKTDPSKKFAVKTISKQKVKRELHILKTELEILKTLDHPNIITFMETYQDQNFFHLVMEYCEGGELFERIVKNGHLREKEAVNLLQKIFSAVKYLHEQGIIHRDLKPENFLYKTRKDDSEIKIIDFGLSWQTYNAFFNNQKQNNVVGTTLYIAPEVLDGIYDYSCDMWSLGIITYILLCGNAPFRGKTDKELFEKIRNGDINYPDSDWTHISKNAKDFVKKLLVVDPKQRLSAKEAFEHPWLKQKIKDQQDDKQGIDPQIINIMKNFRSVGRFKKEVLKIIVNQMSEQEIKKLRQQFRKIDADKKGTISLQQMREIIKQMGHGESDQEIENMLKTFTLDPNAKNISYKTFIGACLDKNIYLTEEKLYSIFKQFDLDNTGNITTENLKLVMARNGRKLEQKDLENLIKDFDLSNNQQISFEEFLTIMNLEKDVDIQSVRESWNTMDITERRAQNQSFGHLGLEISQQNINKNSISENQDMPQMECEIQIVPLENNNKNTNENIDFSQNNSHRNTSLVRIDNNGYQQSNSGFDDSKVNTQNNNNTNGKYLQNNNNINNQNNQNSVRQKQYTTNDSNNLADQMGNSSKNGYNTTNISISNQENIIYNVQNKQINGKGKDIAEIDNSFWGKGIEEGLSPQKLQSYFPQKPNNNVEY